MPYQKVSDKNMERCEAYLKSHGYRRATRGEKSWESTGFSNRVWTFDDLLDKLLTEAGF